jgi:hypothetical protein
MARRGIMISGTIALYEFRTVLGGRRLLELPDV